MPSPTITEQLHEIRIHFSAPFLHILITMSNYKFPSLLKFRKRKKNIEKIFSFIHYSDTVLKCLLQGTKEFTWALLQNRLKVNSLLPVDFSTPPIRLPENWSGWLWERNCTSIHGNAWNPPFFYSCWSSQGLNSLKCHQL